MTINEFNPYDILGIDKETSAEDIKKAFKSKSKVLHPDTGGSPETFNNLKKAFDILTDPAKRSLYDEYGVDDSLDIENEARLVAAQIVVAALDGLPDCCDNIDEEIIKIFSRCLNDLEVQERHAQKARDKLQRRLDAIQKKPVNDFLTGEIIRVIGSHDKAMKHAQLNYRIHDTALKLVKEYKFDITKIAFAEETNSNLLAKSRAELKAQNTRRNLYKDLGMWSL